MVSTMYKEINNDYIKELNKVFQKKKLKIKKIFWNSTTDETIVLAPDSNVDGLYTYNKNKYYNNKKIIEYYVPANDLKMYKRVVTSKNKIFG